MESSSRNEAPAFICVHPAAFAVAAFCGHLRFRRCHALSH
jgi:hypothetical protein